MNETFEKVVIRSEADLPKTGEKYFVGLKNGRRDCYAFMDCGDIEEWMEMIDWYLRPIVASQFRPSAPSKDKIIDLCERAWQGALNKHNDPMNAPGFTLWMKQNISELTAVEPGEKDMSNCKLDICLYPKQNCQLCDNYKPGDGEVFYIGEPDKPKHSIKAKASSIHPDPAEGEDEKLRTPSKTNLNAAAVGFTGQIINTTGGQEWQPSPDKPVSNAGMPNEEEIKGQIIAILHNHGINITVINEEDYDAIVSEIAIFKSHLPANHAGNKIEQSSPIDISDEEIEKWAENEIKLPDKGKIEQQFIPILDFINSIIICYRTGLREGAKWYRSEIKIKLRNELVKFARYEDDKTGLSKYFPLNNDDNINKFVNEYLKQNKE
jgi:hypothetical protein